MNLDKAIACLKELGVKPAVDDFSSRLVVQKIVYLLELKGLKAGFDFNFYVRGPYSPDLTKEIYQNKSKVERLEASVKLSKGELETVQEFKDLFFGFQPGILEIAATYSFFAFQEKYDPITALKKLKELKPFFSETQVALGVSKAKEFLFKPSEKELAEMKEEAKAWQDASLNSV